MKVIYRRCAGLDVHEKTVSVCARILRGKELEIIEATFSTFTEDLEKLRAWLRRNHIRRVAMESTGVYWRPVWNILEESGKLDLILLNPQHVKALPGHKTDRVDAARIAELAQYDLVRASFVPPPEIRELRDLVRRRVHLQQDRNRVSNRIHRLLELQNIKLSSVLGKMTGATARSILEGLSSKMTMKPENLALLARHKRVRDRQPELSKALRCHPDDHFRFLLSELLEEQDRLTAKMRLLEERIQQRMEPYRELIERMCEIPGIERLTAWMVISETGFRLRDIWPVGAGCVRAMPRVRANGIPAAPAKATDMCGGCLSRRPGQRLASAAGGRFSPRFSIGSAAEPERRRQP